MSCYECRRRMCTENLLSELRCAECRQIRFERVCGIAVKAIVLAISGVFGWLIGRSK
jgi:hypothetical protein